MISQFFIYLPKTGVKDFLVKRVIGFFLLLLLFMASSFYATAQTDTDYLSVRDTTVIRHSGQAMVTVNKHSGNTDALVYFATKDGTAKRGRDYMLRKGSMIICNDSSYLMLYVPIVYKWKKQSPREFYVIFSTDSLGMPIHGSTVSTVTIKD